MKSSIKRGVAASCLLTLLLNLTACGYFLYPERKGQTGGRVDPVVVILDGAGLLFGILPGVVAFAVDFTNGTIYLPAGGSSAIDRHLTATDEQGKSRKPVIDQNGQAWLELPLEAVTGEQVLDANKTDAQKLDQVSSALARVTGQKVAVADIMWLHDLASLQQARVQEQATVAR